MKKTTPQALAIQKTFAVITIMLSLVLLVFMIIEEDEPGALPLFMLLLGTLWLLIARYKTNRLHKQN